jgi:hypothetical protein
MEITYGVIGHLLSYVLEYDYESADSNIGDIVLFNENQYPSPCNIPHQQLNNTVPVLLFNTSA